MYAERYLDYNLPFGSVQRMTNNILPTSDVEWINTKNEKSIMK